MQALINTYPTPEDKVSGVNQKELEEWCASSSAYETSLNAAESALRDSIKTVEEDILQCEADRKYVKRVYRAVDWKLHHNNKMWRPAGQYKKYESRNLIRDTKRRFEKYHGTERSLRKDISSNKKVPKEFSTPNIMIILR